VLRSSVLAAVVALCLAPAASARVPGMSTREGNALVTLAKTHWPGLPCTRVDARFMTSGPTARVIGRCLVALNVSKGLDATGWCHALEPAFRTMAGGTAPSSIPYHCNLVVGPLPTERLVSEPPGISHANAVKAIQLASRHWPHSTCKGREQVLPAPNELLVAGSADPPGPGLVIMGEAGLGDPRCVVVLNSDVRWTPTMLCTVAEHEFGHLYGLKHAVDTGDVMTPVNARAVDCEEAFGDLPPALGGDVPVAVADPLGFGAFTSALAADQAAAKARLASPQSE
jgi:hypothetical protein